MRALWTGGWRDIFVLDLGGEGGSEPAPWMRGERGRFGESHKLRRKPLETRQKPREKGKQVLRKEEGLEPDQRGGVDTCWRWLATGASMGVEEPCFWPPFLKQA